MANELPQVGADLTLEMDGWDRNMRRALRGAADFDSALSRARAATASLERTINSVSALVDLQVDDSEIIRAQATIAGLSGEDATVTIHAAMGDIENALRTLDDLNTNTSFSVNVNDEEIANAVSLRENLEANTSFTANADDEEIENAKRKHDDLGDNTSSTADINVVVSGDTDTLDQINDLGGTIELVVNVATTGASLAGGAVGLLGVDELVATDEAAIRLQYTTGQVIENAEGIADALFLANWGESRAQILDYIGAATLLGVEADKMESALTTAFQTSAITGFEMEETLRAQQSLVKNGLVPDFETAGTVIAAAFQSGTNVGDDLLDTVNEYSSTFATLGFTSEQVLSTLNSGLAAGADNTDRIADAVREFGILAREGGEDYRAAIEQLDLTDVYDSFLAGQTTGADFFGQLTQQLGEVEDLATQAAIATATIGTQSEDFSVEVIADITPFQDQLQAIEAATSSVDLIGTDLNSQIEEFSRFAETEIHQALQNAFDIEEFIDNAKSSIDGFFTTLEGGGSLGEAIGVAIDVLNMPILEDFQSTLSALAIGMLQAARDIIGIIPGNQGESGLDDAIAALSGGQFEVDIQVADNSQEIVDSIGTAIDRGVDSADLAASLQTAFSSALARGDLGLAQSIQAALSTVTDGGGIELPLTLDAGVAGEQFITAYQTALDTAMASGDLGAAFDLASTVGDADQIAALSEQIQWTFQAAMASGDFETAASLAAPIEAIIASLSEPIQGSFSGSVETAVTNANEQIMILQANLDALGESNEPVISDDDVAAVETANDSMAVSTEQSSERQQTAVTELSSAHDMEMLAMQAAETATADSVNEAGDRVIETYSLTAEEIKTLETAAIKAFPAIDSAYTKMATSIISQEAALIAALQRITTQIQATVTAAGTLPTNAGGSGAPITLPAPTQAGGNTGTFPMGTTPIPGSGAASGGSTTPNIPGVGNDMPIFLPGVNGGASFDQSITNVNINNVFYPASGAAMAQSGYAVAQAAKGF